MKLQRIENVGDKGGVYLGLSHILSEKPSPASKFRTIYVGNEFFDEDLISALIKVRKKMNRSDQNNISIQDQIALCNSLSDKGITKLSFLRGKE